VTANEASEPTVPERIRACLDDLTKARLRLTEAVKEISWAYADLEKAGGLPASMVEGSDRDATLSEFATRGVLPSRLPAVLEAAERAVTQLKSLIQLVPALPAPVQPEVHEVPRGGAV
jgi:hypothetical protein